MKHKTLPITFLTLFITLTMLSQAVNASPANTLRDLRKQYRSLSTLQANFVEKFEWGMTGEVVEMEGNLHVGNDDRFVIETDLQKIVSDGVSIYRFNKQRNQIIIEAVKSSGEKMLPKRVLLDFTEEFRATAVTNLPVEGKAGYRLDLTPLKPDNLMLKGAVIWATSLDNIVHRIQLVDMNNNTTTYSLTNIQTNVPLSKDATTFIAPDDAEVFDLR